MFHWHFGRVAGCYTYCSTLRLKRRDMLPHRAALQGSGSDVNAALFKLLIIFTSLIADAGKHNIRLSGVPSHRRNMVGLVWNLGYIRSTLRR